MVNFKDTTGILILRPKSGQLLHGDFISNAEKLEQVQLSATKMITGLSISLF